MTGPETEASGGQDLVGTILAGRYRIVSKLGEGAMGAVYMGEHLKMGRRDAIKVLRDAMARDPEAAARFLRGARNVSAIRHPNVCTVYDFSDTDDGLQFLAMEFVAGETLSELLAREGALPPDRAVRIAIQVGGALQAAHDAGVVHRDLKPGNIMIAPAPDGSDVVKVVDFDIAKGPADAEGAEVTRFGFVVGTPEYMSPEQLTGDALDGRSDVYSLGLVVFRMLTGALPFRAKTTQDLMLLRLTERPLRLDEVAPGTSFPPGLQRVLDRALARDRAARHGTAAEFAADIEAVIADPGAGDEPKHPARTGPAPAEPPPAGAARSEPPRPVEVVPPTTTTPASPASHAGAASPSGGPDSDGAPAPVPGSAPPKRPRTVSLSVAAFVAIVAVAGGWIVMDRFIEERDRAGSAPLASDAPATGTPSGAVADTSVAGDADDSRPPGPDPSDPASGPLPRTPEADRPAPSGPAERQPEPRAPSPDRAAGISLSGMAAAAIEDVLFRQMDALGPPYPARSRLLAIRDTAAAVWGRDDVDPGNRALAAYIAGEAHVGLGDEAECVRWLDRAVTLRPDDPNYRRVLEACRSRTR